MTLKRQKAPGGRAGASQADSQSQERQKVIGESLRRMYDEVVSEPVPDDFLKLLEEADSDASRRKQRSSGEREERAETDAQSGDG